MGVMSCFRSSCDNIMCDTYIPSVGYVCRECQNEFKEYLDKEGETDLTEGEIKRALERFMATTKDTFIQGEKISIDDFFNQHTKD